MELKDFITKTISEIMDGVAEAREQSGHVIAPLLPHIKSIDKNEIQFFETISSVTEQKRSIVDRFI